MIILTQIRPRLGTTLIWELGAGIAWVTTFTWGPEGKLGSTNWRHRRNNVVAAENDDDDNVDDDVCNNNDDDVNVNVNVGDTVATSADVYGSTEVVKLARMQKNWWWRGRSKYWGWGGWGELLSVRRVKLLIGTFFVNVQSGHFSVREQLVASNLRLGK